MAFFSKSDQLRSFLWIWSHLLKKSLIENFIFSAVNAITLKINKHLKSDAKKRDWHETDLTIDILFHTNFSIQLSFISGLLVIIHQRKDTT